MANRVYTEEDHWKTAAAYLGTASMKKASEAVQIPYETVRDWCKQEWFLEIIGKIRKENEATYMANAAEIISLGMAEVIDRLKNGDVIVSKNGKVIRKLIGAKDAALITSVFIDKHRIMQGKPTSISAGSPAKLAELHKQFEELSKREPSIEITEEMIDGRIPSPGTG